jgi:hypothetical protein
MKTIAMNFRDGDMGLQMRPEYRGKSTMELILEGKRTATSRDQNKPWNKHSLRIGDIVTFTNKSGQSVRCEITSPPKPISEIDPETWSLKEGWAPSVHQRLLRTGDYHQFEYKLV